MIFETTSLAGSRTAGADDVTDLGLNCLTYLLLRGEENEMILPLLLGTHRKSNPRYWIENNLKLIVNRQTATTCYCQKDAEVADEKVLHKSATADHRLESILKKFPNTAVEDQESANPDPYYTRIPINHDHQASTGKNQFSRQKTDRFVLPTNLLDRQDDWAAYESLSLYKSQIDIEKNSLS